MNDYLDPICSAVGGFLDNQPHLGEGGVDGKVGDLWMWTLGSWRVCYLSRSEIYVALWIPDSLFHAMFDQIASSSIVKS